VRTGGPCRYCLSRPQAAAGALPPADGFVLRRSPALTWICSGPIGHPDEGVKPAIRELLEVLNRPQARSLIHGDRPAIERGHCQGVALRAQRDSGETKTGGDKRLTQPKTS